MLHLNLISEQLKKDIKLRHAYVLLKRSGYILLIFTIFIAIIFLSARVIIQNNFNKIVAETSLIIKNSQKFVDKAKNINKKLKNLSLIQNDFVSWSYVIEEIGRHSSKGIRFRQINIDGKKQELELRGLALSRDDLVNFKDWLDNSEFFLNVDFPIKNILEKENIDFEINAKINLKEIRKVF